ncbi:hypothetical protein Slala05_50370 [Streptomyces lavendulae subsp. lavendulae]|nr:hypothetical protein Slala05_50370 [Streptomyces lavendulae subsp. lavendulae]
MIGSEDPKVTPQEAAARAAHTEGPFTLKVFSWGHFYLVRDHAEVIRTMTDHLRTPVTPDPVRRAGTPRSRPAPPRTPGRSWRTCTHARAITRSACSPGTPAPSPTARSS